jgi:hypothetical protein
MHERDVPVLNSNDVLGHAGGYDRFVARPTGITTMGKSRIDGDSRHHCWDVPCVGTAVDVERYGRSSRSARHRKDPT